MAQPKHASRPSNKAQGPVEDELDDLYDYGGAMMADAFEQVDTNMEPSAAEINKADAANKSTKRKRDGDGLGIDEEIQVKTRRPLFKLDDDLYVNRIFLQW